MAHGAFVTSTHLNTRPKSKALPLTPWLAVPYFLRAIYEEIKLKKVSRNAHVSFHLSPFVKCLMCNNRKAKFVQKFTSR